VQVRTRDSRNADVYWVAARVVLRGRVVTKSFTGMIELFKCDQIER